MDFALERARTLTPDSDSEEYLLEIAWLYNRVVLTGSQIPVIDLAYELVLPEEFIGECVSVVNTGPLCLPSLSQRVQCGSMQIGSPNFALKGLRILRHLIRTGATTT